MIWDGVQPTARPVGLNNFAPKIHTLKPKKKAKRRHHEKSQSHITNLRTMESINASTSPFSPTVTNANLNEIAGQRREITPQQEEARRVRRRLARENDANTNEDEEYTVCRFEVQNLKARGNHANNDYSVSMLVGKHGLFDLVLKVFEILHDGNLTEDEYYDHLWSINFNGHTYYYGWRGFRGSAVDDGLVPTPTSHIDGREIRPLHDLGLEEGQMGDFMGESAYFEFVVKEIGGVPEQGVQYPVYSAIPPLFSSLLSDDWISDDQITECLDARDDWQDYYNGWDYATTVDGHYCHPRAPYWRDFEEELLGLLINAGHKFAKCWKNVLQYAFVDRTKSATSQRWLKLQKEVWRREHICRGYSNEEMTFVAKKLAKSYMEDIPMPPTQAEILAERNEIIEKARLLRTGTFPYRSDGDGGFR